MEGVWLKEGRSLTKNQQWRRGIKINKSYHWRLFNIPWNTFIIYAYRQITLQMANWVSPPTTLKKISGKSTLDVDNVYKHSLPSTRKCGGNSLQPEAFDTGNSISKSSSISLVQTLSAGFIFSTASRCHSWWKYG